MTTFGVCNLPLYCPSSWNENVIKYHPVSHELSPMSSDPCTVMMSSPSNYYIFAVIVENKGSFSFL